MSRKLRDRFEAYVDRTGEHHLWAGSLNKARGTGQLKVDGRMVTAHRVAWELARGPLQPDQRVRACPDNPACQNVEHLSIVGEGASGGDRPGEAPGQPARSARDGGSKRERGKGRWELSVVAGTDEEGRPVRSFRSFRGTEPEATKALALFVAEVTEAGPIQRASGDQTFTVQVLLVEYLAHLEDDKGRSPSTLGRYRGLTKKWINPYLGAKRADRVLPSDIDDVLGRMRRAAQSQSSIGQTRTLLNGAFKWARRNRRISSNPCVEVEIPKSSVASKEVLPPPEDTVLRIIDAAFEVEFSFGVACHLAAATGLRRGEIVGLRWNRVNLDEGYLVVAATVTDVGGRTTIREFTKTRRTRRVSLEPHLIKLLRKHRRQLEDVAAAAEVTIAHDGFIFTRTADGTEPIRPELLSKRLMRIRRDLGLDSGEFDVTMQAVRHWTQTTLSEGGHNSRQIALRGGHSEQLMNRVYVHRTNAAEEEMTKHLGKILNPKRRKTKQDRGPGTEMTE